MSKINFMGPKFWWCVVGVLVVVIALGRAANMPPQSVNTPAPALLPYKNVNCYADGPDLVCPDQAPVGPFSPKTSSP